MKRALAIVGVLVLIGAGIVAGVLLADDGDAVSALEEKLELAEAESEETAAENEDLLEQIDALRLDPEEYALRLDEVLLPFGRKFMALGGEIEDSTSAVEFQALINDGEVDIATTIEALNAINPPGDAQEIHDRILGAFNDFSASLTDVSEAAAGGSQEDLVETAADLEASGLEFQEQLTAASRELRALGIQLTDPADESTT